MEHNSERSDSFEEQHPEQSIVEDDSSVSHPLRAQPQNPSNRLGDVDVESYGGVSPVMSHQKEPPHFNRAIDPQYKFREIYAKAEVKPKPKDPEPVPKKQYSWIERMNKTAVKEDDEDNEPEKEKESLVDKFIDFLNAFGESPEGTPEQEVDHSIQEVDLGAQEIDLSPQQVDPSAQDVDRSSQELGHSTQQHSVEFEPSEDAYDTTQADITSRRDDTTQNEPILLPSKSSRSISSYGTGEISEFNMSDNQYDNYQQVERLDDNARRNSWSKPSGLHQSGLQEPQPIVFSTPRKQPDSKISKSAPSKSHRSSFGTRRFDPFHMQEHPSYPGASSPNWGAGTFASPEDSPAKSRKLSGRHAFDDSSFAQNGRRKSRQGSVEAVKPSSYLSIPPMLPSELCLEPLHHPSSQVDWLTFDDLGIDKLFDAPLVGADKAMVKDISQHLSDEAVGNKSVSKIMPPTVPSSLALNCLLNPSPSCLDWASWDIDDIGLERLMPAEDGLPESSSLNEWINRTHSSEQRPMKTSALHEQTNQDSSCLPVIEPRPHKLGVNLSTMFDSQDTSGDFDKSASTTGRIHDTIQRPKNVQTDWHLGSEGSIKDVPPEINVNDSWSSYMALKAAQERPPPVEDRYQSPGSLAQDNFDSKYNGPSHLSNLAQASSVNVEEAVEQRKLRKREMREENRSKDWADNMDDNQLETLFPQQFEDSTDRSSQQEIGAESKVPTWTTEYESKNWLSESGYLATPLHGVKADTDEDAQNPQLQLHHKLHGIVDTVASSVGAVAGTAVGAISYLFGESSHSAEEKPRETSYASNAALNAGDQKYAKEHEEDEGVQAIATVPDSHLVDAEEQLYVAKQEKPDLSLGHVDDDSHIINLHPSLLRPTEKRELSSEQPLGSSDHLSYPSAAPQLELPENLQHGADKTTESDLTDNAVSQNMAVVLDDQDGNEQVVDSAPETKTESANDNEIRNLFNGDPDSVRQSFKSDDPHKTTMDDRRQIWEASVSSALGQAASTLGLKPQSKEKKLDLENYHVVDSGYKPSTYEPGRNQFDSDFENWRHDSPSSTPFNEAETKPSEATDEQAPIVAENSESDQRAALPDQNSMTISSLPLGKPITYELGRFNECTDWKHESPSRTPFNEAEAQRSEATDSPKKITDIVSGQQILHDQDSMAMSSMPSGKSSTYEPGRNQLDNGSEFGKHDISKITFDEAQTKRGEASGKQAPTEAKNIESGQDTLPDQNSMTISSLPLGKPITYEPGRSVLVNDSGNWNQGFLPVTPVTVAETKQSEETDQRVNRNEGFLPVTPVTVAETKRSEETDQQVPVQTENIGNDQQVVPDQNSTTTSSLSSGKPTWDRAEFHDPSDYMKGTESHMQQQQPQQPDTTTSSSHTGRGPTGWIRRKLNKRRARAAR
ncbi:hypothetical protein K450DRAFT_216977 [Umbelopsis ramanniana AG]|uniref:Uncharacterized protein n=1 Tax=Umbelopsis ramanniana AG TaxID=1314678 RepID=A0AAD5EKC4_UMBRA|nr:uncharacterized protein K450DRAFT_216977 [Umbelopsis ramanniana AG]KAI8584576.1 hypothetical protein K450DRAFT_216977 [Umbelopsis ramanniana AG]